MTKFQIGNNVRFPYLMSGLVKSIIEGQIIKLDTGGTIRQVRITQEPQPVNPHQDKIANTPSHLKCGEIMDFLLHGEEIDHGNIILIS
ncbi:hypothetical protein H6G04_33650 [Calothrix membranacea FACHB-236]|nr:hypothetical protein [Calothrix membranacea FACHB-236]